MSSDQSTERRSEPRTKMGLAVVFSFGLDSAPATLKDLSTSGALLEPALIRPQIGDIVTLFLDDGLHEEPESVNTEVVRRTADGFAVTFCLPWSIVNLIVSKFGDRAGASSR